MITTTTTTTMAKKTPFASDVKHDCFAVFVVFLYNW